MESEVSKRLEEYKKHKKMLEEMEEELRSDINTLSLQSEIKQLNFNKTIEERNDETSKISQEINKIEEILNN
jgi:hypothetical protein